jgi:acyl-CoA thioester hydrolase
MERFLFIKGGRRMKKPSYINNIEIWKHDFTFNREIRVRFCETDMFGHMNNTVPFLYFEEARTAFFQHIGFMEIWKKPDSETMPVVADLQCDFVQQVFFGEVLSVKTKIEHTGRSSVDLHYVGINEKEEICFTGRGALVQVSKSTGKSVPWTEEQLEKLKPYQSKKK